MIICYIISEVDKSLSLEWTAIELQKVFDIRFILLNRGDSELEKFLKANNFKVSRINISGKKSWLLTFFKLLKQINYWSPRIVHCHLQQATILGLTAAWILQVKMRIFTRHHGSLHHDYHKKGIIWDIICNTLATKIVAISTNVKNILIEKDRASFNKIRLIVHGFDWTGFRNVEQSATLKIKFKYNLIGRKPIIGCISRFTEWKGIQYIIPAFRKILIDYPESILILANAQGDYFDEINIALKTLPIENYRIIKFESELYALYSCLDLFIHVPVNKEVEAFGQVYIEALASEVPSIFTLSGIAIDFVENHKNCLIVPYKNSDLIYNSIILLLNSPELCIKIKEAGWISVREKFSLAEMVTKLKIMYEEN